MNEYNTKILNHLDLVLSNQKNLKEKNIHKYYKALGGNYKIDSDKTIHDSYKLFKLGVKNNFNVNTLVYKLKGSAPNLYDKLEKKITKKYLRGGEGKDAPTKKKAPGAIKKENTDNDDLESVATNFSSMSDVPDPEKYSEDKLQTISKGYAILNYEIVDFNDVEKLVTQASMVDLTIVMDHSQFMHNNLAKEFYKLYGDDPSDWEIKKVLDWIGKAYKQTNAYRELYGESFLKLREKIKPEDQPKEDTRFDLLLDKNMFGIYDRNQGAVSVDTKFGTVTYNKQENKIYAPGFTLYIKNAQNPWQIENDPGDEALKNVMEGDPDPTISILFGRDGLLIGLYDILLRPTKFSKQLIQFLLYHLYYINPSHSILNLTGWTSTIKGKIIFNPVAKLLMRLIEVLWYINVKYLYPQCVRKNSNEKCDNINEACQYPFLKIDRMNRDFMNNLTKQASGSMLEKIQLQMTAGTYSTLFREHFEFRNFRIKTEITRYENRIVFRMPKCDDILKSKPISKIEYTWRFKGCIYDNDSKDTDKPGCGLGKKRGGLDYSDHEYDSGHKDYNRGGYDNYPRDDEYNRGGYDNYPRDDEYTRGGYDNYPRDDEYTRGGYDNYPRDDDYNRGGYDNYPRDDDYNRGGYDNYPRDDEYTRGGYNSRYYPDNMHGGALGIFRQQINRTLPISYKV
jgi:hypothetical protein